MTQTIAPVLIPNYPYYDGQKFDSVPYFEYDTIKRNPDAKIVLYYEEYPTIDELLEFTNMVELQLIQCETHSVKTFRFSAKKILPIMNELYKFSNLKKLTFLNFSPCKKINMFPQNLEVLEISTFLNGGLKISLNLPTTLKQLIICTNNSNDGKNDIKRLCQDLKLLKLPYNCQVYVIIEDLDLHSSEEATYRLKQYKTSHVKEVCSISTFNINFFINYCKNLYDISTDANYELFVNYFTDEKIKILNVQTERIQKEIDEYVKKNMCK